MISLFILRGIPQPQRIPTIMKFEQNGRSTELRIYSTVRTVAQTDPLIVQYQINWRPFDVHGQIIAEELTFTTKSL